MAADDSMRAPQSQTLDRGIRILEHLAAARGPLPITSIAQAVELHRSIAYRLLRTLEAHRLVERDSAGRFGLGLGMVALSRGVRQDLQTVALPRLDALVRELAMTAFMVVRAGDEAVTVTSIEPQHATAHVTYRPGTRHRVDRGAPGLALLMPEAPSPADRNELVEARRVGWARSHGEVVAGLRSIAAPVLGPDGTARAALAVVFVDDALDETAVGRRVSAAAASVSLDLL